MFLEKEMTSQDILVEEMVDMILTLYHLICPKRLTKEHPRKSERLRKEKAYVTYISRTCELTVEIF